jgi:hypothetical protein
LSTYPAKKSVFKNRDAVFENDNIIDAFWQTLYPKDFLSMPQNPGSFDDVIFERNLRTVVACRDLMDIKLPQNCHSLEKLFRLLHKNNR